LNDVAGGATPWSGPIRLTKYAKYIMNPVL